MKSEKLPFVLFAGGVALLVLAILWSLYSYGVVGQLVVAKGLRPNQVFHCMYGWGGNCVELNAAHAAKGTIAYWPATFWLGVVSILASFWLNLRKRMPDEAWEPRLQRLLLPVDRVSTFVGQSFAWCILALTLAVSYEVFSRYLLRAPTNWGFDASYILYGSLFIMAGAYAMSRNGHVRGDFIYRAWSERGQAWSDLILHFLFFFPGIAAFIYAGYGYAAQSWMLHEISPYSPDGLPVYHFKTLVPITGTLLLLQGIVEVVRCLICIRTGKWPQRLHDVEELEKVILEQHAGDGAAS
jgi:TRAP-type mannitol/chloroaromatic compound transport system permease small subunit